MKWLWLGLALVTVVGGLAWLIVASNQPTTTETAVTAKPNVSVPEPVVQAEAPVPAKVASVYVPILMYHYIRDYTDPNDPLGVQLSVSPATLDKQLTALETAGYKTISLQDFVNKKYSPKSIILTFDDGYDDQYINALPLLQKHHDTATFFIVSGFVDKPRYMTTSQILDLKAAGMEIGGHTIDHKNLANQSYETAIEEISVSMVDRDPVFAYPSGKYNAVTLDIVSALGIKAAVTTNIGIATETSSVYELPRIRVKNHTDVLKVISEEIAIAKHEMSPSERGTN